MNKIHLAVALGGMALAGIATVQTFPSLIPGLSPPGLPPSDPANRALVAQGRDLYATQCAQCHGARLEGEDPDWKRRKDNGLLYAPPHDVSGHTWHHPDGVLIAIMRDGGQVNAPPGFTSGMPAFGETLGDTKLGAILAFIKSTWPKDARARQAAISQGPGQ
ncbi:MAG: c-type cytochrome [Rhodospirillum sp.]|nr:c-type cytochrome [Rhodospirillum sp.]MCF8487935.1 c-type cytochrome [Rhodospirillum sp.]MCF8500664.1 c-type cytochrome [Rhodospirillum sp.]